jgi:hypothetical protein
MPSNIRWGQPHRYICWLVQPSSFDCKHLPPHMMLKYVLRDIFGKDGYNRPGRVLAQDFDREAIQEISAELYRAKIPHVLSTEWYSMDGSRVSKTDWVQRKRKQGAEIYQFPKIHRYKGGLVHSTGDD